MDLGSRKTAFKYYGAEIPALLSFEGHNDRAFKVGRDIPPTPCVILTVPTAVLVSSIES